MGLSPQPFALKAAIRLNEFAAVAVYEKPLSPSGLRTEPKFSYVLVGIRKNFKGEVFKYYLLTSFYLNFHFPIFNAHHCEWCDVRSFETAGMCQSSLAIINNQYT